MNKLIAALIAVLLLSGMAWGQARVDIDATGCFPLQADPSCELTPSPATERADWEQVNLVQSCAHTGPQGFACPFQWPPGAAVTGGSGYEVGLEMGVIPISGTPGSIETTFCSDVWVMCRTIVGSGDERVQVTPTGVGQWPTLARSIVNESTDSFIYRGTSSDTVGTMAPGATGARCALYVIRNVGSALGCDETSYAVGYEYFTLAIPAP